jgi:hypothetical protein
MRIVARKNGSQQEAYKLHERVYKCCPRSNNKADSAQEFATIEEAAIFLIKHPGWGIRMNPGSAITYDGISILLD